MSLFETLVRPNRVVLGLPQKFGPFVVVRGCAMMEADPIHQLATGGLVYGKNLADIIALIALPDEPGRSSENFRVLTWTFG